MKKIYIAGPMSGYPDLNFPAFFAAEEALIAMGFDVFNPATKAQEAAMDAEAFHNGDMVDAIDKGFDLRDALLWDVTKVIEADGICLLRGWEQSSGARAEQALAATMQKNYPEYRILYAS